MSRDNYLDKYVVGVLEGTVVSEVYQCGAAYEDSSQNNESPVAF